MEFHYIRINDHACTDFPDVFNFDFKPVFARRDDQPSKFLPVESNDRNNRKRCEIYSKLTLKTP